MKSKLSIVVSDDTTEICINGESITDRCLDYKIEHGEYGGSVVTLKLVCGEPTTAASKSKP